MSLSAIGAVTSSVITNSQGSAPTASPELLASIKKCTGAYSAHFNQKKYWAAYQDLLRARPLYEQKPEGTTKTKNLIWLETNLVRAAVAYRNEKRYQEAMAGCTTFALFLFCVTLPCVCYYSCKAFPDEWIGDEELQAHRDRAVGLSDGLIEQLSRENGITMGTDKNSVPDSVRKDLAYVKYCLGSLRELGEEKASALNGQYDCCVQVTTCCCRASKSEFVVRADNATALSLYKMAMEWDPTDTDYSREHNRLETWMKRPIINVTYTTIRY